MLLFGNATEHSSTLEQLVSYLHEYHLEIAERVIGVVKPNVEALSDHRLFAEAHNFYSQMARDG